MLVQAFRPEAAVDAYGAHVWTLQKGRTPAHGLPARPPQDDDAGRWLAQHRNGVPLMIDGPINGEWFEAYVAEFLVPTLKPGDVVILDNLSSHKRPAAREVIEAVGARMLFLPPYSSDFNPIEKAFSQLKALLRKAAERSVTGICGWIGKLFQLVEPQGARDFFTSRGYGRA